MAKKMLGAAAITAALAGGGALGALLGAPVLTAAQEEPATTTAPPATSEVQPDGTQPDGSQSDGSQPDDAKDCGDGVRRGFPGIRLGTVTAAEALGMTTDELRDALRDGASIASIVEERGVDLQSVVDSLIAEATARIDERVADGKIDESDAAAAKEALAERVQSFVEREGGRHRGR